MALRQHVSELRAEDEILNRIMYKIKSQHRCTLYYRKLQQVYRSLKLLRIAASDEFLNHLDSSIASGGKRKKPKINKMDTANTLWGIARILHELNLPILDASKHFSGLLGEGRFMALALTVVSVLARVRVLSFQLLLDAVSLYNQLLTQAVATRNGSNNLRVDLVFSSPVHQELPASLECKWDPDRVQYELIEHERKNDSWFTDDRSKDKNPAKVSSLPADATPSSASQAPSLTAAEFLDFLEKPETGNSKKVAYVSVAPNPSTSEQVNSTEVVNAPKDTIFDLLLPKQSIF